MRTAAAVVDLLLLISAGWLISLASGFHRHPRMASPASLSSSSSSSSSFLSPHPCGISRTLWTSKTTTSTQRLHQDHLLLQRGKNNNNDDDNGVNDDAPFFARLVDTWKKDATNRVTTGPEEDPAAERGGSVAVAERAPMGSDESSGVNEHEEERKKGSFGIGDGSDPLALASELRAQAKRARLEAERMEAMLLLDKIGALERKLQSKTLLERRPQEAEEIRRQIRSLTDKLNGSGGGGGGGEAESMPLKIETEREDASPPVLMTTPTANLLEETPEKTPSPTSSSSEVDIDWTKLNLTTATREDLYRMVPPIPEDELKLKVEAFLKAPLLIREMTAKSVGFDSTNNATAIVERMYMDEQVLEIEKKMPSSSLPSGGKGGPPQSGPLEGEALENALEGYMKLPLPIQDLIAKSVGMPDGRNASAVIIKLNDEGKLWAEGGGVNTFEVDTEFITDVDVSEILREAEAVDRDRFIEVQLPAATRKRGMTPSREDVDVLFSDVLGRDTFNPTEKPIAVPGGFIIYGENKKKNGENLVDALDRAIEKSSIAGKLQVFYMIDPSPIRREQLESLEGPDEKPAVLYVAGTDFTPGTNKLVKPLVSLIGLVFMASFALGSLTLNEGAVDRFFEQLDSGVTDFAWIEKNTVPIFAGLCLTQLSHEVAHQLAAWRGKFKAGLPTIVPSLQVGLLGGVTPIQTPPRNVNGLFDFALSGPLVGMAVSIMLLITGLEATTYMDAATQGQLPSLPVNLVRSSSLAGAMVEGILGEGILLTPNPAIDTINLHPLAIAGFVGLLSNALSLLPLGNTDGGRVAQALFGRSWCRILTTFTSLFMVISGLFGIDNVNLLLFYSLYATLAQRETEIPCRNEVDDLDVTRAFAALATFFLVMLALIPMS